MNRGRPPKRKTPLTRTSGLKPGRRSGTPKDTKIQLELRSHGWCEAGLWLCTGRACDTQHRITQKSGGRHGAARERHNRLANVIDVCRMCHDWITNNPTAAKDLGLSLEEWQDPATEPVLLLRYSSEPVYLDDSGKWFRFGEVGP